MSFYQAMQLGASQLKPLIAKTEDKTLKSKYKWAFIIKNILCILFCMAIVISFSTLFGEENSIVGVVTVITLMAFRFSNFNFKTRSSAVAMMFIFIVLIVSPYIAVNVHPVWGSMVNFISIMTIMIVCCNNIQLSNQSILVLSYLLLYGYQVNSFEGYKKRVVALIFGGIIVSVIFYFKHRKEVFEKCFLDVLREVDFKTDKTKWQFKLALGISLGMLIGELVHMPRVMWIGFTIMSILQPTLDKVAFRTKKRPPFVIIGCVLFGFVYLVLPEAYRGYIGLIGGLMVGFSATYEWQTSFNCFGALAAAVPTFGLMGAVIIRIVNNVVGAVYSKCFDRVFNRLERMICIKSNHSKLEEGA